MPSKPFSSRSKEKEDAKEEKLANERERIRNKIFELEFKEIEVYMIENQGFGSGSARIRMFWTPCMVFCVNHPFQAIWNRKNFINSFTFFFFLSCSETSET